MRPVLALFLISLLLNFSLLGLGLARANGEIFPSAPAAENSVNWKDGYFYVKGKPTFLTAGEMHYARIPRELWRDRIWRSKQMGFNCMQMYVFWNATESKQGQWDFTDNLDLDAWLSLVQEMGMYAIVRVGPYSCAEWESGGFPGWLLAQPGMTLRDSGAAYQSAADSHLAQVEKIVAKHQINRGGSVIMVQVENEHPRGWGTDNGNGHLNHLLDQARANGLEVPLFLSGLHHGSDPSGEKPYDLGKSPWFTTEFWTGWIGKYGDMDPGMLNEKIRGTWKIIAFGGGGYDYYMVHGGTNFGYSGNTLEATYDYSAPIGETGQFHNFYFAARRAAWFAQSFSSLLTGSHNDPDFARSDLPGLRVTTRTNPTGGSIVFVDNFQKKVDAKSLPEVPPDSSAYTAPSADKSGFLATRITIGGMSLPHQGSLKVGPAEPRTILVNVPWTMNATFESVCTNVLFRLTLGMTDYWVCYGPAGDSGEVTLQRKVPGSMPAQVNFTYPTDATVKEIDLDSGDGRQAKFLVMNTEMTQKAWLARDQLYLGASFVRENGGIEFPLEGGRATVYSATGKSEVAQAAVAAPTLPEISGWTWRDAATERNPAFSLDGWSVAQGPQVFGTDGFQNRYGWYRTSFRMDAAGPLALHFAGQSGTFATFFNGQPASLDHLEGKAGDNTLAILAAVGPRPTLWKVTGLVGADLNRGLWGGVSTESSPFTPDIAWKKWEATGKPGNLDDLAKPGYNDLAWASAPASTNRVEKGESWFRGTFTLTAPQVESFVQPPAFGDAKTVLYLNGQRMGGTFQDVSKVLTPGSNTILLNVQSNKAQEGSLAFGLWRISPLSQGKWFFRGGLTNLQETAIVGRVTNWDAFLSGAPWQSGEPTPAGLPTFWKSSFTYRHPVGIHETIGLMTPGLKLGHVWLNGHNLGASPQKVPLYLPECWLKDGENELVVFDFYGAKPDQLKLSRYEAFSVAGTP